MAEDEDFAANCKGVVFWVDPNVAVVGGAAVGVGNFAGIFFVVSVELQIPDEVELAQFGIAFYLFCALLAVRERIGNFARVVIDCDHSAEAQAAVLVGVNNAVGLARGGVGESPVALDFSLGAVGVLDVCGGAAFGFGACEGQKAERKYNREDFFHFFVGLFFGGLSCWWTNFFGVCFLCRLVLKGTTRDKRLPRKCPESVETCI